MCLHASQDGCRLLLQVTHNKVMPGLNRPCAVLPGSLFVARLCCAALHHSPLLPLSVLSSSLDCGALLAHDSAHLPVGQNQPDGAHRLGLQLIVQQRLDTVHGCVKASTVLVLHVLC